MPQHHQLRPTLEPHPPVQRHGRIDRIGSPHDDVYMRCFFPDARMETLLDLEARIRHKVAQTAATVGIEHEVIPGAATSDVVFAETREEIEKLRAENPELLETGGELTGAQSGEAYRQELRKGLERFGGQIENLPWGSGSRMRGERDGHFFCARVGERVYLRFVPTDQSTILGDSLTCLRLITCNTGISVESMSSTTRWEEPRLSALLIKSRLIAASPAKFSSCPSTSVSNDCSREVSAAPRSQVFSEPISRKVGSCESRSASIHLAPKVERL